MSTGTNPYASPTPAEPNVPDAAENAQLLRARCWNRETTVRCLGVMKLGTFVFALLMVLPEPNVSPRGQVSWWIPALSFLVILALSQLVLLFGLWRLAAWARGLQIVISVCMFLVALWMIPTNDVGLLAGMFLALWHMGVLYLLISRPAAEIFSPAYRHTIQATADRPLARVIVVKSLLILPMWLLASLWIFVVQI